MFYLWSLFNVLSTSLLHCRCVHSMDLISIHIVSANDPKTHVQGGIIYQMPMARVCDSTMSSRKFV